MIALVRYTDSDIISGNVELLLPDCESSLFVLQINQETKED